MSFVKLLLESKSIIFSCYWYIISKLKDMLNLELSCRLANINLTLWTELECVYHDTESASKFRLNVTWTLWRTNSRLVYRWNRIWTSFSSFEKHKKWKKKKKNTSAHFPSFLILRSKVLYKISIKWRQFVLWLRHFNRSD